MKTCYYVAGPASSGNRYAVRLLVESGCYGAGDVDQPFDGPDDTLVVPPDGPERIALLRSFPHGRRWPDLAAEVAQVRSAGYAVTVIVMARDPLACERSHVETGHTPTIEGARTWIDRAWREIGRGLGALPREVPVLVVPHASLARPTFRRWFLGRLGLEPKGQPEPWTDPDAKHYTAYERERDANGQ